MVVSAGDHQCPDRGMGAVPEITRELAAAIRLPRPLNVLAGLDVLSRAESCLTRLRSILSSCDKAAIERRAKEYRSCRSLPGSSRL